METLATVFSKGSLWGIVDLILVLLGTNPYSFCRLARAADAYAEKTGDDVLIQLGYTRYVPLNAKYVRFLNKNELIKNIEQADLVITQGGFGSIADCLNAGKRVVAIPRKPELKEAPDRQEELVRELEKLGRLVGVYEIKDLPEAIQKAKRAEFKQADRQVVSKLIKQFIGDNR